MVEEEKPAKKGKPPMLIPTIVLGVIAVVLLFIGYYQGEGRHITGTKMGLSMLVDIIPLLIFALIVAGMVQVLMPPEMVGKWVGAESGLRGILIGTVAGGIAPGGPYVSLPIALGLMKSGAGIGTMVAFLTGWSLWAFARMPMDVGILGWKLSLIRLACTFFFPPIAGLIAHLLFSDVKI